MFVNLYDNFRRILCVYKIVVYYNHVLCVILKTSVNDTASNLNQIRL